MRDQSRTQKLPESKDRCKKYCASVSKSPSNFTLKICLSSCGGECKEWVLEAAKVLYETGRVIRWQHAGVSGTDAKLISLLFIADIPLFSICLQSPLIFSFDDSPIPSFLSCPLSLSQEGCAFPFILFPDVNNTLGIKRKCFWERLS